MEIGYYKGYSFDQVKGVELKVAVDPNPSKEPWMQEREFGSFMDIVDDVRIQINKETSDSFFSRLSEEKKVDIIFVDGLHEASQVTRDIENSLKHLSLGGTIVLHDCNPPTYEHTTTGDHAGNWNGDVYKAFIKFRYHHPEYKTYTVDTDWGCGIIHNATEQEKLEKKVGIFNPNLYGNKTADEIINDWDCFSQNRKDLLGIVSVEKFIEFEEYLKEINERITDNHLSAK